MKKGRQQSRRAREKRQREPTHTHDKEKRPGSGDDRERERDDEGTHEQHTNPTLAHVCVRRREPLCLRCRWTEKFKFYFLRGGCLAVCGPASNPCANKLHLPSVHRASDTSRPLKNPAAHGCIIKYVGTVPVDATILLYDRRRKSDLFSSFQDQYVYMTKLLDTC